MRQILIGHYSGDETVLDEVMIYNACPYDSDFDYPQSTVHKHCSYPLDRSKVAKGFTFNFKYSRLAIKLVNI